jgi:hypothetical protein
MAFHYTHPYFHAYSILLLLLLSILFPLPSLALMFAGAGKGEPRVWKIVSDVEVLKAVAGNSILGRSILLLPQFYSSFLRRVVQFDDKICQAIEIKGIVFGRLNLSYIDHAAEFEWQISLISKLSLNNPSSSIPSESAIVSVAL